MLGPRWNQKPPAGVLIDPTNSLAHGLVAFWSLSEGTGLPVERVGSVSASSNSATWVGSRYGPVLAFSGTNQWVAAPPPPVLTTIAGPFTIVALASPAAGVATQMLVDYHNATTNLGIALTVNWNGNNELDLLTCYGSNFTFAMSTSGVVDGAWHVWGASFASSSSGGTSFFRDGQPMGTATQPAPVAYSGGTVGLGALGGGTNRFLKGSIGWAVVWSRALSPGEHTALAANPWQVFRPQSDLAHLYATASGSRVSYPRGSSIFRPVQLPTSDLYCYLD